MYAYSLALAEVESKRTVLNEQIGKFLRSRIDAGDFPSAVYLVAEKGEIVFSDALGYAVEPERIEARLDTIYDLASLTKVLATGLLLAKRIQDDEYLGPDTPLYKMFRELRSRSIGELSLKHLLTHTSGFQAWRPFYLAFSQPGHEREAAKAAIVDTSSDRESDRAVIYSDLNFILLERFLSRAFDDDSLVPLFQHFIAQPLQLTKTFFNPPAGCLETIAASEHGNEYERQMCIELGYVKPSATAGDSDSRFRDYQIWGEVHDNNAYFMGGVAGHAGLFSTAEEVFKIAQQFLPNYTQLLKPETCELFRTNFTPGMNEDRSFAFQLASTKDSTAGTKMSPQSFGHNGFTGTSLWIDPVRERVFILLTNRTHNHALPFVNINSVRRYFHDLAAERLDENR